MKTGLIVTLAALLAYTSIQLTKARHEVRTWELAAQITEDISDMGVGADMDGLGDWQEVAK